MKREPPEQTVRVSLPIAFVEALRTIQSTLDDDTASAPAASVGDAPEANAAAVRPIRSNNLRRRLALGKMRQKGKRTP